jgi:outer membrane lipoprotein SlyB
MPIRNLIPAIPTWAAILLACAIGACASHPDPIIDTKGVNMVAYEQDLADCKTYSEQVKIESGMARGAATGAATGGAVGVIRGGDKVAEDAAVGAILGASKSGTQGAKEKERVVKNCLRYRGYRVLN